MWKGLSLLVANEFGLAIRRNATAIALYAVAGTIFLIGSVFALLALRDWLALGMSTTEAGLAVAAGLLFLAGLVALCGLYVKRRRRSSAALASTAMLAVPIASRMLGRHVNVGTVAVLGVVALGAILGRQFRKS